MKLSLKEIVRQKLPILKRDASAAHFDFAYLIFDITCASKGELLDLARSLTPQEVFDLPPQIPVLIGRILGLEFLGDVEIAKTSLQLIQPFCTPEEEKGAIFSICSKSGISPEDIFKKNDQ